KWPMKWNQWVVVVMTLWLTVTHGPDALAEDWITKGGSPQRMSVVADPQGLLQLTVHWETGALGESAAQPVVIDGVVYHLAGEYLWKVDLNQVNPPTANATPIQDPVLRVPVKVNRVPDG